jgi:hypothetical protein
MCVYLIEIIEIIWKIAILVVGSNIKNSGISLAFIRFWLLAAALMHHAASLLRKRPRNAQHALNSMAGSRKSAQLVAAVASFIPRPPWTPTHDQGMSGV